MAKSQKTLGQMMAVSSKGALAVIPFVIITYVTWRVLSEVDWRLVQTRNPFRRRQQAPQPPAQPARTPTPPRPQPQAVQHTPNRGELLEID